MTIRLHRVLSTFVVVLTLVSALPLNFCRADKPGGHPAASSKRGAVFRERVLAALKVLNSNGSRDRLGPQLAGDALQVFLCKLDPHKVIFQAADVKGVLSKRQQVAEALNEGDIQIVLETYDLYRKRFAARVKLFSKLANERLPVAEGNAPIFEPALNDHSDSDEVIQNKSRNLMAYWTAVFQSTGSREAESRKRALAIFENQLKKSLAGSDEQACHEFLKALAVASEPHARYLAPAELQLQSGSTIVRARDRIAVRFLDKDGRLVVASMDGDAASMEREPIEPGDVLIGVDADASGKMVNVVGWDASHTGFLLGGHAGSNVRVTFCRYGTTQCYTRQLKRRSPLIPPTSSLHEFMHQGRVVRLGYLLLPAFYWGFSEGENPRETAASHELDNLFKTFSNNDVKAVVIDLRGNDTRLLAELIQVAAKLLPRGLIVTIKADGKSKKYEVAGDQADTALSLPLVVLIDETTGRDGAVLAAALSDNGRALLVGSGPTSIHGYGYNLYQLKPEGSKDRDEFGCILYPNEMQFRPDGTSLAKVAVQPHILLSQFAWPFYASARESNCTVKRLDSMETVEAAKPTFLPESAIQELRQRSQQRLRNWTDHDLNGDAENEQRPNHKEPAFDPRKAVLTETMKITLDYAEYLTNRQP